MPMTRMDKVGELTRAKEVTVTVVLDDDDHIRVAIRRQRAEICVVAIPATVTMITSESDRCAGKRVNWLID
jgi:hypothetical protein